MVVGAINSLGLILVAVILYQVNENLDNLNYKLSNADIRIDICLNEQAKIQDKIEEAVQDVRFEIEELQMMLGVK